MKQEKKRRNIFEEEEIVGDEDELQTVCSPKSGYFHSVISLSALAPDGRHYTFGGT